MNNNALSHWKVTTSHHPLLIGEFVFSFYLLFSVVSERLVGLVLGAHLQAERAAHRRVQHANQHGGFRV